MCKQVCVVKPIEFHCFTTYGKVFVSKIEKIICKYQEPLTIFFYKLSIGFNNLHARRATNVNFCMCPAVILLATGDRACANFKDCLNKSIQCDLSINCHVDKAGFLATNSLHRTTPSKMRHHCAYVIL